MIDSTDLDADLRKRIERPHIRWMIRCDMDEVRGIERRVFEFPWFEEDFIRCLRQRNCVGMVAERGDRIVGFMVYELHAKKVNIMNFAVHPEDQRTGVGQAMLGKLLSKLDDLCRVRITLEVRETNLEAQKFFRSMGFKAVAVLHDYYEDSPEDAYVMEYVEQRIKELDANKP